MGTNAHERNDLIMYRIDVYKDATSPALIARLYKPLAEVKATAEAFTGYYVIVNKVKE